MSRMKDYLATIYGGGDEAVEIAQQLMGLSDFTVQDEPRWIPVEERLPEDRVNVLTCGDDPVDGPFILIGRREPESKFGPPHWHLPCFAFGPVTHWMPLPEPPEMK